MSSREQIIKALKEQGGSEITDSFVSQFSIEDLKETYDSQ